MSEIIHAKAGVVVLPHARAQSEDLVGSTRSMTASKAAANFATAAVPVSYPTAIVDCIARAIVVDGRRKRQHPGWAREGHDESAEPPIFRRPDDAVTEAVAREMSRREQEEQREGIVVMDEGVIPRYIQDLAEDPVVRYALDPAV
jgi:hypothetical protein